MLKLHINIFNKKMLPIIATNTTLKSIVINECNRLGKLANLNHIDVSQVTFMHSLFHNSSFNGDISEWNVSNVKNTSLMFLGSSFNGDISKWDVSNITEMYGMFSHSNFNGNLSSWSFHPNLQIDEKLHELLENSYIKKNQKEAKLLKSGMNFNNLSQTIHSL
jgi:surface protein